jgi:Dolichyl-phosphate-mannose-protein mannosyltransferase
MQLEKVKTDRALMLVATISLAMALLHAVSIWRLPPVEGDSYEYASLARSLVENRALLENHVWFHLEGIRELPAPATYRTGLYPFLLVPFYLVFGESHLTFSVPGVLMLLFFPLLVYAFGRRIFRDRWMACTIALAMALHPRIIFVYFFQEAGQPDLLVAMLWLGSCTAFLEGKYARAGLATGLAFLTKQTAGLLPLSFVLSMLIFDRGGFRKKGIYVYLGISLAVVLPLLLRNLAVLGSISHLSNYGWHLHPATQTLGNKEWISILFDPHALQGLSGAVASTGVAWIEGVAYNLWGLLVGIQSIFEYEHGLLNLVGLLAAALFFVGAIGDRPRLPAARLALIQLLLFAAAYTFGNILYCSRHIFPLLPFIYYFIFRGVRLISTRFGFEFFTVKRVFLFLLITEIVPVLALEVMLGASGGRSEVYRELQEACGYLHENAEEDEPLITLPFQSPEFLCHRATVSLPYGGADNLLYLKQAYQARYFLYYGFDIAPAPGYDFLEEVLKGQHVTLYRFKEGAQAPPGAAGEFNLLEYTLQDSARVQFLPGFYSAIARALKDIKWSSAAAYSVAFVVYAIFFLIAFAAFGVQSSRVRRIMARTALILLVLLGLTGRYIGIFFEINPIEMKKGLGKPLLHLGQAGAYFADRDLEGLQPRSVVLTKGKGWEIPVARLLDWRFPQLGDVALQPFCSRTPPAFCVSLLPLTEDDLQLADNGWRANAEAVSEYLKVQQSRRSTMQGLGYETSTVGGAVFGVLYPVAATEGENDRR